MFVLHLQKKFVCVVVEGKIAEPWYEHWNFLQNNRSCVSVLSFECMAVRNRELMLVIREFCFCWYNKLWTPHLAGAVLSSFLVNFFHLFIRIFHFSVHLEKRNQESEKKTIIFWKKNTYLFLVSSNMVNFFYSSDFSIQNESEK